MALSGFYRLDLTLTSNIGPKTYLIHTGSTHDSTAIVTGYPGVKLDAQHTVGSDRTLFGLEPVNKSWLHFERLVIRFVFKDAYWSPYLYSIPPDIQP